MDFAARNCLSEENFTNRFLGGFPCILSYFWNASTKGPFGLFFLGLLTFTVSLFVRS